MSEKIDGHVLCCLYPDVEMETRPYSSKTWHSLRRFLFGVTNSSKWSSRGGGMGVSFSIERKEIITEDLILSTDSVVNVVYSAMFVALK